MKTIYIIQCYHSHNDAHIITSETAYTIKAKAEQDCANRNKRDNENGLYYEVDTIFIDNGN